MAALPDLSALVNRQSGGNNGNPDNRFPFKVPRISGAAATAPIAGLWHSLWRYEGMPAAGAIPTTAAIPDRTTQGALPFTAPGGSRQKLLLATGAAASVGGTYLLYDRLMHIGGLSGTSTAAQTVQGTGPTPALTRNTGGLGNFAFYEIYEQIGNTSVTLTMTYTDQDGNTGQTSTINIGTANNRNVTRAQRIPMAAGDDGLRAVREIQLSASTGTVGNFGITIAQPLAIAIGPYGWRDFTTGLPGIPEIHPDACLAVLFQPVTATAPEVMFPMGMVEN